MINCSVSPASQCSYEHSSMSTFTHSPVFDYYYKACRKGDAEAKAVTVNQSTVRASSTPSLLQVRPQTGVKAKWVKLSTILLLRLGTIASRNPGRSRVRDLNRLVLRVGDLVYDLDVNHVTINNSDAFILLSALGGIVIHGSVLTIPSRIARVNWVWIIVLN